MIKESDYGQKYSSVLMCASKEANEREAGRPIYHYPLYMKKLLKERKIRR